MSRLFTFGIVGGYGSTGKAVISALHSATSSNLLIGGRDLDRTQAVAAPLGARVSASLLDILDPPSLDTFCSKCSVIINCAGPVSILEDRVAQAAFRNLCHYVDPAGLTLVKERMLPNADVAAAAGLCFVISAGWMPGLTELFPLYAYGRAKEKMESLESVSIYSADRGEWSESALLDGAWFLHKRGLCAPHSYSNGEPVRAKSRAAMRAVTLEPPLPSGRFGLYAIPELEEVCRGMTDCDVFPYAYVPGVSGIFASLLLALVPLPEPVAVSLVRSIFRANRMDVGGFVAVEVRGTAQGKPSILRSSITFEHGRDYWLHGTVLATVARLIAEGKRVRPGVHFLSEAVAPRVLRSALGSGGIVARESFETEADALSSR